MDRQIHEESEREMLEQEKVLQKKLRKERREQDLLELRQMADVCKAKICNVIIEKCVHLKCLCLPNKKNLK